MRSLTAAVDTICWNMRTAFSYYFAKISSEYSTRATALFFFIIKISIFVSFAFQEDLKVFVASHAFQYAKNRFSMPFDQRTGYIIIYDVQQRKYCAPHGSVNSAFDVWNASLARQTAFVNEYLFKDDKDKFLSYID